MILFPKKPNEMKMSRKITLLHIAVSALLFYACGQQPSPDTPPKETFPEKAYSPDCVLKDGVILMDDNAGFSYSVLDSARIRISATRADKLEIGVGDIRLCPFPRTARLVFWDELNESMPMCTRQFRLVWRMCLKNCMWMRVST